MCTATLPTEPRVYYRFEAIDQEGSDLVPDASEPLSTIENFSASSASTKTGFWRRQFARNGTRKQLGFDWTVGVIIPLICFYFDPIVFRGNSGFENGALFPGYRLPVYILGFTAIMAMAAWLLWGRRLGSLAGPIGLLFAFSAVISFFLGVVLFPFSVVGLVIAIGALGFTPFLSAIVYARNAKRAFAVGGESH